MRLSEIAKLEQIAALELPENLFEDIPAKILQEYRVRASAERPTELRRHPAAVRYTLVAAFCWQRRKEIIDGLVDLLQMWVWFTEMDVEFNLEWPGDGVGEGQMGNVD